MSKLGTLIQDVWPWSSVTRPDPSLDPTLTSDIATIRTIIGLAIRLANLTRQVEDAGLATPGSVTSSQIRTVWKSIVQLDTIGASSGISVLVGYLFDPTSIPSAPPAPAPVPAPVHSVPTTRKGAAMVRRYVFGRAMRMNSSVQDSIQIIQNVRRVTTTIGILILFAMGFNLLYVNVQGFGHSAYDYIKVIAWSFGTGAAGRGLSTTIGNWAQNLLF